MLLHNSDGSAEWTSSHPGGDTRVICAVNGPIEVKNRDELPTMATLELVVRPVVGLPTIREVQMQDCVYGCLRSVILRSQLPRSLVQIVVQVLETGEPAEHVVYELVGATNSSVLALVNAGIPMSGLVVAVCLAIVNGEVILNPGVPQLKQAQSTHALAYKVDNGPDFRFRLVMCESSGLFSEHELEEVLSVAADAARDENNNLRRVIEQQVTESLAGVSS